jgi:hypothetical protein
VDAVFSRGQFRDLNRDLHTVGSGSDLCRSNFCALRVHDIGMGCFGSTLSQRRNSGEENQQGDCQKSEVHSSFSFKNCSFVKGEPIIAREARAFDALQVTGYTFAGMTSFSDAVEYYLAFDPDP